MIEAMDLEHAFMHILDKLSGHLEQFEEENDRGDEDQDDVQLVSKSLTGDHVCSCWCI